MTVRQRMDDILSNNPTLLDSGEFSIDYRHHSIIQNPTDPEIILVYESRDDIDDNDKPVTIVIRYESLKVFFNDYPPNYQNIRS